MGQGPVALPLLCAWCHTVMPLPVRGVPQAMNPGAGAGPRDTVCESLKKPDPITALPRRALPGREGPAVSACRCTAALATPCGSFHALGRRSPGQAAGRWPPDRSVQLWIASPPTRPWAASAVWQILWYGLC
jgi:hypothetical protein